MNLIIYKAYAFGENNMVDYVNKEIKKGTDFSGKDLHGVSFFNALGENIKFDNANLERCDFTGSRFENASFRNANLRNAKLVNCDLRFADFTGADFRGTLFQCTIMEGSIHDNVIIDDKTQNYKMHCPETGAFLGYKKCFNNLLVTLLIPADARRVCSTTRPCRCDKAKVINITSFDFKEHYKEAWSLCSSYDFKYTLGEMVYPDSFNPDRWMESTHGIHFWMTMEEAMAY